LVANDSIASSVLSLMVAASFNPVMVESKSSLLAAIAVSISTFLAVYSALTFSTTYFSDFTNAAYYSNDYSLFSKSQYKVLYFNPYLIASFFILLI